MSGVSTLGAQPSPAMCLVCVSPVFPNVSRAHNHSDLCLAGVAIYTGMETKMALNYQAKSQKRSAVEK